MTAKLSRDGDAFPSHHVMRMYLQQRGWQRYQRPPQAHEPTLWIDPMGLHEGALLTRTAYSLQTRRDAHGVKP